MIINYDTYTSVVPGWNTILTDTKILNAAFYVWIVAVFCIYYQLFKKKIKLNKVLLVFYLLLTVPLLSIVILIDCIQFDQNSIFKFNIIIQLLVLSIPLYLIGQLLFLYQLIKIYRKQKSQPI